VMRATRLAKDKDTLMGNSFRVRGGSCKGLIGG
jgi:hypothetical protein